jgi:hypothetical protein
VCSGLSPRASAVGPWQAHPGTSTHTYMDTHFCYIADFRLSPKAHSGRFPALETPLSSMRFLHVTCHPPPSSSPQGCSLHPTWVLMSQAGGPPGVPLSPPGLGPHGGSLQTSLGVLPVVNNSRAGGWHLSLCLHPQGPHYLLVARLPFKDCGLSRLHSGFPWSEASSYHPHWVGGCGWQSFSSSFMGPDERSPVA